MSLEVLGQSVRNLRESAAPSRDSRWAFRACELTRSIVMRLMESWPTSEEVSEVLNTLQDLPKEVRNVRKEGPFADRIEKFAQSIEFRIRELEDYVQWDKENSAPAEPSLRPPHVRRKVSSWLSLGRRH